jgi:L-threonylcarbamoyladenylate synthase
MAECGTHTDKAAAFLKEGRLVAIPTETVYGLAANALNEQAVLSIFEAKNRPYFDPLIIHLPHIHAVEKYADWHDKRLKVLAEKFWPGPLTMLIPKKGMIPDLVTSGLKQVAVRVPNHPLTLRLLNAIDFPLAAPSANPFGYVSPTTADHVQKQLGARVAYILDGGACAVGIESTIVGAEDGDICVYRLGGLSLEEIETCVGKVTVRLNVSSNPTAPGQLKNHYAPRKPLFLGNLKKLVNEHADKKIFALIFGNSDLMLQNGFVRNLSVNASDKEAAVNLFSVLREADESDADVIIAEMLPEKGLGAAINDRLNRASVR